MNTVPARRRLTTPASRRAAARCRPRARPAPAPAADAAAPASNALDREAGQVRFGLRRIEHFAIEEFFDATRRRRGDLRRRHLEFLRRRAPQILAVDLRDQR